MNFALRKAGHTADYRIVDSLLAAGAFISEELLAMATNNAWSYPQFLEMLNAATKERKKKAYEKRKKEEKKKAKALAAEAAKAGEHVAEVEEE